MSVNKILQKSEFLKTILYMRKKLWVYFPSVIVDAIITAFCSKIIFALFMKDLLNSVTKAEIVLFIRTMIFISIVLIFSCIFQPISRFITKRCVKNFIAEIRLDAYTHLTELPAEYFEKQHRGDVLSRLTNDIGIIDGLYSEQTGNLILTFFIGIGSVIVMFILQWRVAAVFLILGSLLVFLNMRLSKWIRKIHNSMQEQLGKLTENFVDILSGTHETKIFQIEDIILERYTGENDKLLGKWIRYSLINTIIAGANDFVSLLRNMGVIILGMFLLMNGYIDIGTTIAIFYLQENVFFMFRNISNYLVQIQSMLAGAKRVFDFMNFSSESEYFKSGNLAESESMIEMRGVSFSYDDGRKCIDDFNINVNHGQVAAIIGTSGCGKSTVIKLLMGLYKHDSGSIFIHGKPIEEYSLYELREKITYIPQDPILFSGTIYENIQLGSLHATQNEIEAAARSAYAHDFILQLPEGYNTAVGERGINLSVGQRQRIAIARALIKNSPIILLDEPTSALDTETEQYINETLSKLIKGHTVIIAAHRLYTIKNADIIYCINNGKVAEAGNHEKLMENNGLYSKLYKTQFINNLNY